MELPPYFLSQPPANWDADVTAAFDRLFEDVTAQGSGAEREYTLPYPKWQFLCYLATQKGIVLHGSGRADIAEFEPRQSNDVNEFGNRRAIYAASDGLWAMYFAIVDRENHITSLVNSCFWVVGPNGKQGPFYFFSVNGDALPHDPWRNGTIYLLPGDSFEQQPSLMVQGSIIESAQLASVVPVTPLAKLSVTPDDFPFLAQIVPHDPVQVRERAAADPDGFPWMDVPHV